MPWHTRRTAAPPWQVAQDLLAAGCAAERGRKVRHGRRAAGRILQTLRAPQGQPVPVLPPDGHQGGAVMAQPLPWPPTLADVPQPASHPGNGGGRTVPAVDRDGSTLPDRRAGRELLRQAARRLSAVLGGQRLDGPSRCGRRVRPTPVSPAAPPSWGSPASRSRSARHLPGLRPVRASPRWRNAGLTPCSWNRPGADRGRDPAGTPLVVVEPGLIVRAGATTTPPSLTPP